MRFLQRERSMTFKERKRENERQREGKRFKKRECMAFKKREESMRDNER